VSSQILHNNYLVEGNFLSVNASTEDVGYPVTNTYIEPRRKRFWKTTGHFYIPGSATIVFQEVASVDVTATIPEANYATPSELATAIKDALDLAGTSTYTVTYNSATRRFTITSNGFGGNIFNLEWWQNQEIADILGFANVSMSGSLSYTSNVPRSMTSEFVIIDFGSPVNPDAVIMSWATDIKPPVSPGATMLIEGNHSNDFDVVGQQYGSDFQRVVPFNRRGFAAYKPSEDDVGIAPTAYRYWRVSIIDRENPLGVIEIGSFFFGDGLAFRRGKVQFPFDLSYEAAVSRQTTYNGSVIAYSRYITRSFGTSWFGLTQAEKDSADDFFMIHSLSKPFYLMADSGSVLSSDPTRSLFYCRLESPPSWTMDFPGVYSLDMSMREEI